MLIELIKKTLYAIFATPILIIIFIIGLPFRLFNRIPPMTRSAIQSPYSFVVSLLELTESKIDFIFNIIAFGFFIFFMVFIFHITF
tara:strand:- start:536 stop:793 length:258 start_codon:yes stop_codon:yes gene_type:complete